MLEVLRDGVLIAGVAAITFGLWQVYQPAAWIFCGSAAAAASIALARSAR